MSLPATGRGVVIGVVDFGLDFHHTDLRHADGSTRVLGLWDQAALPGLGGGTPGPDDIGRVWLKEDIDADLRGDRPYRVVSHRWDRLKGTGTRRLGSDGAGWMRHGTHTAAVAMGNGRSDHPSVPGPASDAELVFVSLDPAVPLAAADDPWGQAGAQAVVAGVRWILALVEALEMQRGHAVPVVINLSLSQNTGSHDGCSVFADVLDGLHDRPGRVVVAAAGNANQDGSHALGWVEAALAGEGAGPGLGLLDLIVGEGACSDDALELWVEGLAACSLLIGPPRGCAPIVLGAGQASVRAHVSAAGQSVSVRVVRAQHPRARLGGIRIKDQGQLPVGRWTVRLFGQAPQPRRVWGWLAWTNAGVRRFAVPVIDHGSLSDLCCHRAPISVGCTWRRPTDGVDLLDPCSGRGPTRDGRDGPDIAAPGVSLRMAEAHCRVALGTGLRREYLTATGSGDRARVRRGGGAARCCGASGARRPAAPGDVDSAPGPCLASRDRQPRRRCWGSGSRGGLPRAEPCTGYPRSTPLSSVDPLFVPLAAVALGGAVVQGISGFGFGMVCMALLPLFVPVDQAVPMVGAWGWSLNLFLLWRLRGHLEIRKVLPLIGGAVVGIPLGLVFLRGADPRLVRAVLGLVLLGYSLFALLGGLGPGRRPISDRFGVLAGLVGGALGGAFNTPAPPIVVYVSLKGWPKHLATSSLQAFFMFTSTFAVLGFATVGLFTPQVIHRVLPLYPAVWLGSFVGTRIYDRVPQARFRILILALLIVLGGNFLVRAALGT
ncbi:MAG: TSUP family transporter [Oligoflexia bacterium]|nr:TSUP family transporter [Oligoflexia bacterium]